MEGVRALLYSICSRERVSRSPVSVADMFHSNHLDVKQKIEAGRQAQSISLSIAIIAKYVAKYPRVSQVYIG